MEPIIKELYKGAIKNEKFLEAMFDADGDEKPSMFAHQNEKVAFAAMYYGWLVAEYGIAWKLYIRNL